MHHSVPDAIFYGSERLPEPGRDFSLTHSLKVSHLEWRPLLLGKTLEGLAHRFPPIGQNEGVRIGTLNGRFGAIFEYFVTDQPAAARSGAIDGSRSRDREKPYDRLAARGIITAGLMPDLPEHVEKNVFGVFSIADDPQDQRKSEPVVARVKRIECHGVPGRHASNQVPVFMLDAFLVRHDALMIMGGLLLVSRRLAELVALHLLADSARRSYIERCFSPNRKVRPMVTPIG